ncbi:hypothetical protein D3C80_1788870 [compost metagenome]
MNFLHRLWTRIEHNGQAVVPFPATDQSNHFRTAFHNQHLRGRVFGALRRGSPTKPPGNLEPGDAGALGFP